MRGRLNEIYMNRIIHSYIYVLHEGTFSVRAYKFVGIRDACSRVYRICIINGVRESYINEIRSRRWETIYMYK